MGNAFAYSLKWYIRRMIDDWCFYFRSWFRLVNRDSVLSCKWKNWIMKKLIIISLVIMFVAVAAHGVYLSKTVNSLSNIVLANVEALAFREDDSKGVGTILTHDLGKGTKCENGILYSVYKYSIDCFGEGTLPCQSGTYESFSPMGKCYEV